ncbi:MAG TPA: phage tail terminator-like protein [Candidatus Bathyarchaeia archaeon]
MTPDAAADAIETALATAWGTTTPISWANVPFMPPDTGSWLKVDFIWGNGAVLTKTVPAVGGINSIVGIVQLAVFGPKDLGDGAISALAETARAIFNRKRLASPNDDVMFGAVSAPVALFEESWRSFVVTAPFRVLETVP